MSSTAEQTSVPTGTWNADPVHSSVGFEVPYAVNVFTALVPDLEAKLEDGKLTGAARMASLKVMDENLQGHLQSPEFFDIEQHPEVRFESSEIRRNGDEVEIDGELTIK